MIGDKVNHPMSGVWGEVEAVTEHPDGVVLVRVRDRWFFATDTRPAQW